VLVVAITSRIRERVRPTPRAAPASPGRSRGRERISRLFQRFGIPGVALIGHPTQISSAAMVGLGANRTKVLVWELVSVVAWGSAVAVLGGLGIEVIAH